MDDDRVLHELGDELMRLARRRTQDYPGSRLDTSAFRLLWLLTEGPPRTLRELAEEMQLDQSTVNRQVNAAIKHGLVERYAVSGSSSRLLRPTDSGRAAYLHDGALRAEVYHQVLDELGPGRAEALVAELRELNDGLDRAHSRLGGRAEPPPR
jgi:DNA-binding MarR family transcriptional regulator